MRNIYLSAILLFSTHIVFSQQIEIGPTLGYGYVNIVDSKSDNDRAVIGDALWNPNFGINAVYYFKNPIEQFTGRLGLLYKNNTRGSVSEIDNSNSFDFNANSIAIFGGIAGNIGKDYIFYIDVGFGYNSLEKDNIFSGSLTQTSAFPDLNEDLIIKSNEITFVYGIGVEKEVFKKNFKVFLELNGDAAISKLNENTGTYRTQALGFGSGIRYIFDLKSKK